MLTVHECRRRIDGDLFKVRTLWLFGVLPVYRQYWQLTVRGGHSLPCERET